MAILPTHGLLPAEELRRFGEGLFLPNDLVELRIVQGWHEAGEKKGARLISRAWLPALELPASYEALRAWNEEGHHVFFGVNPRVEEGGTKGAVRVARSVWADFDLPDYREVRSRVRSVLPEPSIIVASGHGFHCYWLLEEPYALGSDSDRERFEALLKRLYGALGSDSIQDVSRLLRLPGFRNPKPPRPVPCRLLVCEQNRRYGLSTFSPWMHEEKELAHEGMLSAAALPGARDARRIAGLLRYLEQEVDDRSRRDFGVLCGLLRLDPSLGEAELWRLVQGRSKFTDDRQGQRYFQTTLHNAKRALGC